LEYPPDKPSMSSDITDIPCIARSRGSSIVDIHDLKTRDSLQTS
ncbi:1153_t:CDS:1, partial [Dentiscutata heterogama]